MVLADFIDNVQQYIINMYNTPIYFNTNYRTEMKLVPIIMDYCLLQLDALIFFRDPYTWEVST